LHSRVSTIRTGEWRAVTCKVGHRRSEETVTMRPKLASLKPSKNGWCCHAGRRREARLNLSALDLNING
jgi:hypothetical protein